MVPVVGNRFALPGLPVAGDLEGEFPVGEIEGCVCGGFGVGVFAHGVEGWAEVADVGCDVPEGVGGHEFGCFVEDAVPFLKSLVIWE